MSNHPWRLDIVTPASGLAVPLDVVKEYMDIDFAAKDSLIQELIQAATERAQRVTTRQLLNATLRLFLPCFPDDDVIRLPRAPLVSVAHVKYIAADGTETTISADDYIVSSEFGLPTVSPAVAKYWPTHALRPDAVRVQFTAGYGSSSATVPTEFRTRIMAAVRHLFDTRAGSAMQDEEYLDGLFRPLASGAYP